MNLRELVNELTKLYNYLPGSTEVAMVIHDSKFTKKFEEVEFKDEYKGSIRKVLAANVHDITLKDGKVYLS